MCPEVFLKGNKKSIEKQIKREWRELTKEFDSANSTSKQNPSNDDIHKLKLRYVRKCRELDTYGITCFLVKEKEKGKNRMVPRLLGMS